jgi:hypothetical protein
MAIPRIVEAKLPAVTPAPLASLLRPCLINNKGAAFEVRSIQRLDGLFAPLMRPFDKAEVPGLSAEFI